MIVGLSSAPKSRFAAISRSNPSEMSSSERSVPPTSACVVSTVSSPPPCTSRYGVCQYLPVRMTFLSGPPHDTGNWRPSWNHLPSLKAQVPVLNILVHGTCLICHPRFRVERPAASTEGGVLCELGQERRDGDSFPTGNERPRGINWGKSPGFEGDRWPNWTWREPRWRCSLPSTSSSRWRGWGCRS